MTVAIRGLIPLVATCLLMHALPVRAVDRVYYIAAVEENWDYGPSGTNNITARPYPQNSVAGFYMLNAPTRVGSVYKKALFREFTSSDFRTPSPRPEWLGIMGPIMRAEVGDKVIVHFRNLASMPLSINPGGLTYTKSAEGAFYNDSTSGKLKNDDNVQPNQTFVYRWDVTAQSAGPKQGAENCIAWPYSSQRNKPRDENSGLVGVTIVCKRGFLSSTQNDIVLFYGVFDENQSWYIDENYRTYAPQANAQTREDEMSQRFNRRYTVNGYSFGNLPGLDVCRGDRVRTFLFTLGDETSIHSVFFNGNPLEHDGKRADTIPLIPGPVEVVYIQADTPGTWLISSLSTTDGTNGGSALYTVRSDCNGNTTTATSDAPLTGIVREHFIGVQEVDWNYAPYASKSPTGSGPSFRKAMYLAFTDMSFRNFKVRTQDERYLGMVGPVIRAEVGDTIRVTLLNRSPKFAFSIHPTNVQYDKANEGFRYAKQQADVGDAVRSSSWNTYTWTVPASYGPTANDGTCITGMYYSTVYGERDLHSGLVGPLLVCRQGSLFPNGTQANINRAIVTMALTINEQLSLYSRDNQNVRYNADFPISEIRTINGYVSDNLRGLEVCEGDLVSWHAQCIGNEETYMGLHIPYQTFKYKGRRANTIPLVAGQTEEVQFKARNPGTWRMNGNVYNYDLQVNFTVADCYRTVNNQQARGRERTFYLAAEEVIWDYTPDSYDYVRGQNLTDPESAGNYFVAEGNTLIGKRYKKARFVEYTDETFTKQKPRSYWDSHLGIMGPMIRVEADETVRIVFQNNASMPYSVNAHNLPGQVTEYNGQTVNEPIATQPGERAVYRWSHLDKAAPTDKQPNCVAWPYYSSVITKMDTNTGLIAPLVVCRKGTLNNKDQRMDVDRDFALLFTTFDENDSWYLDENIQMFARSAGMVNKSGSAFMSSNDAFAINGYIFGHPLNISMVVGEKIAFYILVVGGGADVHSINFHGHTVTERSDVTKTLDSVAALPGEFRSVEMTAKNPGTWLLHDAINMHSSLGMETRYNVFRTKREIPCGRECSTSAGGGRGAGGPGSSANRSLATYATLFLAVMFGRLMFN